MSMSAMPTPPDCEAIARPPGGGTASLNVALSRSSGSLLITPRQLGPTSRMLCDRARSSISRWRAAPSAPISWNPDEITTAVRTPAAPASRSASSTRAAGTATMARSTCSGRSVKWADDATPATTAPLGCTTCRVPV